MIDILILWALVSLIFGALWAYAGFVNRGR